MAPDNEQAQKLYDSLDRGREHGAFIRTIHDKNIKTMGKKMRVFYIKNVMYIDKGEC